tara:strand:+ start:42181 stop:42354 length:174 start_codon:yes stop_codon:yes gene_type:complete
MTENLSPKMAARRAALAEAIIPMLEARKVKLDAGRPASSEDRARLEEDLAWWSREAK